MRRSTIVVKTGFLPPTADLNRPKPGRECWFEIRNSIGLLIDTWLTGAPDLDRRPEIEDQGAGFAEESH